MQTIALVGGGHAGTDATLREGLYSFNETGPNWLLYDFARHGSEADQAIRAVALKPAAIVASVTNPFVAEVLRNAKCPVFCTTHAIPNLPFHRVGFDDDAIGRMAADYFLERGFQHFGFAGHPSWPSSDNRLAAFRDTLARRGIGLSVCTLSWSDDAHRHSDVARARAAWLQALPKPAAVFADSDFIARAICLAARTADISIPEDVSVLGVDNYTLVCKLAQPQLSSIDLSGHRLGQELGRLIANTLAGKPPAKPLLLPPVAVVTRRSTDAVAATDPNLAAALKLIHEHVATGITVKQILQEVPVSRVQLFRLFRKIVGRSPMEEIQRLRCEHAKRLLATTKLPMYELAERCGFRNPIHMARVFRSITGTTPRDYRKKNGKTRPIPNH